MASAFLSPYAMSPLLNAWTNDGTPHPSLPLPPHWPQSQHPLPLWTSPPTINTATNTNPNNNNNSSNTRGRSLKHFTTYSRNALTKSPSPRDRVTWSFKNYLGFM